MNTLTTATPAVCNHCEADGVLEMAVWFTGQGTPLCDRHADGDGPYYPVYPITLASHQYDKLVRERDSYKASYDRTYKWMSECQTKHKCIHNPDCPFSDEL
jgi:hypothetical protein